MKKFLKTLLVFFKLKRKEMPIIFKGFGASIGIAFLFFFGFSIPLLLVSFILGIIHILIYPNIIISNLMDGDNYYSATAGLGFVDMWAIIALSLCIWLIYKFFSWIRDNWRKAKRMVD